MSDIIDRYKSGERDFTQENLFRENLAGVVLTGSVLVEANCCEANLEGADLSYCDLRRVNFHKANLRGANLTGSDLLQANLCEADTTDAVFDNANLHQANLYLTKGREQAERVGNLSETWTLPKAVELQRIAAKLKELQVTALAANVQAVAAAEIAKVAPVKEVSDGDINSR